MMGYVAQILRVVDRKALLVLLLSSLLITVMEVLSVSAVIPAIGVILGNHLPTWIVSLLARVGIETAAAQKMAILAIISGVFLARGLLLSAILLVQARVVFSVQKKLSDRLFQRYLSAEFAQIDAISSAHLLRVSTAELANITHGVILPTATFVSEIALISGAVIVLLLLQPLVALLLIGVAGALSAPIFRLNRTRLTQMGRSRHEMESERYQFAQEIIAGAREIKVYKLEPQLVAAIGTTNRIYSRVLAKITFLQNFPRLYLETTGICVLLLVCALLLLRGNDPANTLTFMMIFGLATFRALPSLAKILAQLQALKFYRPSLGALLQLLDDLQLVAPAAVAEVAECSGTAVVGERREICITMTNAAYQYRSATTPVFSKMNLAVSSGELVGIIGPSGVGKSTLLDCLIGLRAPTSGAVTIIDKSTRAIVQPRIAYVPQSPVILDASVWRNITLSPAEPTIPGDSARLCEALEISGLDRLMKSRQLTLTSRIVEGGRNMSGGQRQRLALARALYREADVFVLDEATSALDRDSENEIIEAIKTRRRDCLVLLVTHHSELLSHCDKVIEIAFADSGEPTFAVIG